MLVGEALKHSRKNKTTIVITHDLTPIASTDFVYVLTEGCVVEQGYREDLESNLGGHFYSLAHAQRMNGVGGPDDEGNDQEALEWEFLDEEYYANISCEPDSPVQSNFAVTGGLFSAPTSNLTRAGRDLQAARYATTTFGGRAENRRSMAVLGQGRPSVGPFMDPAGYIRRRSSSVTNLPPNLPPSYERRPSTMSTAALDRVAESAATRRQANLRGARIKHRTMADLDSKSKGDLKKLDGDHVVVRIEPDEKPPIEMSLVELAKIYYPTIPRKWSLWIGIFLSVGLGACTPAFSFLLARLMANLGVPNPGSIVITTSLLILMLAFIESIITVVKYYILETCAENWTITIRARVLDLVLKQDKTFYDRPENSTSSLVHIITNDVDQTRDIIGTLIPALTTVVGMLLIGILWAFTAGWELSLVGVAFAPIFIFATRAQNEVLKKFEIKNKLIREEISKKFHQVRSFSR